MLLSMPGKVLNRVLLERMKDAVDLTLRDNQAGFWKNRSCADQIASLGIIIEQSLDWNSPLYINFINFEKAFDSLETDEALWDPREDHLHCPKHLPRNVLQSGALLPNIRKF